MSHGTEGRWSRERVSAERDALRSVIKTLHTDRPPHIASEKGREEYEKYVSELVALLVDVRGHMTKNGRMPASFSYSQTWKDRTVHLVHVRDGRVQKKPYVLARSTPSAFIAEVARFFEVGDGTGPERPRAEPKRENSGENAGAAGSASAENPGGSQDQRSREDYERQRQERDRELKQRMDFYEAGIANIHFDFSEADDFDAYSDRSNAVRTIDHFLQDKGDRYKDIKLILMNSIIKPNTMTPHVIVERGAGAKTIYLPNAGYGVIEHQLRQIVQGMLKGEAAAGEDMNALRFRSAKRVKDAYRLRALRLTTLTANEDIDFALGALSRAMDAVGAQKFAGYAIALSNQDVAVSG